MIQGYSGVEILFVLAPTLSRSLSLGSVVIKALAFQGLFTGHLRLPDATVCPFAHPELPVNGEKVPSSRRRTLQD